MTEAETPGTLANVPVVNIVEFDVKSALPQKFDQVETVLPPAMTKRATEEIANTSPPAAVATAEEVVTMHEVAEPMATPSAISACGIIVAEAKNYGNKATRSQGAVSCGHHFVVVQG